MKTADVPQDSRFFYGWVVLGASFLALFSTFGIRVSFGSYVTAWENEFAISRTAVTTISLVSFLVVALAQPLIGRFNDRFGSRIVLTVSMVATGVALFLCSMATRPWQLVLLYGVAASFALTGASQITAAAVVTHWFTAKRGLAMGITTSGMAAGQLAVVPLSLYLISHYNWRFTLGLLSMIVLVVFTPLVAFLIRSKPADIGLRPYGESSILIKDEKLAGSDTQTVSPSVRTVLRQPIFWQLSIPYFFCGFTDVGLVNTHYIPFTQGSGFSVGIIAFTFSLIAIANVFGTIGTGYLADRWNRGRLLALIYFVRGLTFLFILIADKPWLLMIFALIYGITEMASIAPTSSICAHLFGKYSFGVIYGVISISHQLGGAIGSMVPGIIYDSAHSYVPSFVLSAILITISALIVSRVPDDRGQEQLESAL